jgi:hypothetical protein
MMKRMTSVALVALLIGACSILPGRAMTLDVDGVPVTCSITDSSIEGGDPLAPGPESQTQCIARAREAMGTVLAAQPSAQIESVSIAANGGATVCYSVAGVRSCPQVLPAMPTL